ncbi:cytochrome P450 [Amycolatopsis taiwanensis]|uniref:cytochrome P450 n=1 Tax=Amycolatopsis taiwanensis TaxID=342230 RepID=UPI000489CD2B|nr:cytochrome P450 [Amycolatopsis taiwanensis]
MVTISDAWGIGQAQFWLRGKQPDQPVCFDVAAGVWNVYGFPETLAVLSDPKTFSSDTARVVPEQFHLLADGNLGELDPPRHTKLRKLVSHTFTPKVVAGLEPRIAALTHELLDAVAGRPRIELVADLAYPLPVTVIADLLGVPASDRHLFKESVDKMVGSSGQFSLVHHSEEQDSALRTTKEQIENIAGYLRDHVAHRRQRPRTDLLTQLVEAEVDGERLSDAEVVNFAIILLFAGHITTTMLLGNTVLCLDAHPEQFAKARADRSIVPAVVEESLRLFSPFAVISRVTTADVLLGEQHLPADQLVRLWLAAANRDPRQFADPNSFDPTRDPNPHLGFGRGIHFCLGAPLARLEGRVVLNILFDRFAHLRSDPDDPPRFIPAPSLTGVSKFPLLTSP